MGTGAGAVRDRRQESCEGAPVKRRRTRGRLAGASNERQWRALGGTVIERIGGRRSRAAVRGIRGTVRGLDVRGRQRRCPANSESVTSQEVFPLVGRMRTGIVANWTRPRWRTGLRGSQGLRDRPRAKRSRPNKTRDADMGADARSTGTCDGRKHGQDASSELWTALQKALSGRAHPANSGRARSRRYACAKGVLRQDTPYRRSTPAGRAPQRARRGANADAGGRRGRGDLGERWTHPAADAAPAPKARHGRTRPPQRARRGLPGGYFAMSFWIRSMASTVASASPKAVRRT